MSGRIAKSQIPVRCQASLPPDARSALIKAKYDLQTKQPFREGPNEKDRRKDRRDGLRLR